jgi:hypothetical protein
MGQPDDINKYVLRWADDRKIDDRWSDHNRITSTLQRDWSYFDQ